jgi:hypothetical protein
MKPESRERTGNGKAANVLPLTQPKPKTAIKPMTNDPATLFKSNEPVIPLPM